MSNICFFNCFHDYRAIEILLCCPTDHTSQAVAVIRLFQRMCSSVLDNGRTVLPVILTPQESSLSVMTELGYRRSPNRRLESLIPLEPLSNADIPSSFQKILHPNVEWRDRATLEEPSDRAKSKVYGDEKAGSKCRITDELAGRSPFRP